MRLLALALVFLMMPIALADIDITLPQTSYNIGDNIDFSASISSERSGNAYVHFSAQCADFSLPFFLTPIELVEGYRVQIDTPSLRVSSAMKGVCIIRADLAGENGNRIEEASSLSFFVSDGLKIVLLDENMSTLPGEIMKIEGLVRDASDNTVNADITLTFDNESYSITTFNGKFILMLPIAHNAKSGLHPLYITAKSGQNAGSISADIVVQAVPSHLTVEVQPAEQQPGKEIDYTVSVTDQANDPIADTVEVHFVKSDATFLYKGAVPSGGPQLYVLSQYLAPGEYKVKAFYQNLGAEAVFTVTAIKDVVISQQGDIVQIENIGNVQYKDEVGIILENSERSYSVKEKVDLGPGEIATIELGKEVPHGFYNVLVPDYEIRLENGSMQGQPLLAQNVEVMDQRSSLKRVGAGMSSVTGAIVGSDGVITRSAWMAPVIMVGIVLLIGVYFTRDIWLMMLLRRK